VVCLVGAGFVLMHVFFFALFFSFQFSFAYSIVDWNPVCRKNKGKKETLTCVASASNLEKADILSRHISLFISVELVAL
jgi:hypothetical protein